MQTLEIFHVSGCPGDPVAKTPNTGGPDLIPSQGAIQRRQWHPAPVLLPGKSHGRRSLVGCSPWGHWELDMTEQLHFPFSLSCIGEGKGNPLQCSCLENPRDGGAWWAAIYGVAQSRTRLKWLSSSSSRRELLIDAMCHNSGASQVALLERNPPADAGDVRDLGLIPGLGRSPRGRNGNSLQYSCLGNPVDRGVSRATVHRVTQSGTRLQRLSMHACHN